MAGVLARVGSRPGSLSVVVGAGVETAGLAGEESEDGAEDGADDGEQGVGDGGGVGVGVAYFDDGDGGAAGDDREADGGGEEEDDEFEDGPVAEHGGVSSRGSWPFFVFVGFRLGLGFGGGVGHVPIVLRLVVTFGEVDDGDDGGDDDEEGGGDGGEGEHGVVDVHRPLPRIHGCLRGAAYFPMFHSVPWSWFGLISDG